MRIHPVLATLLAGVPCLASAQSDVPLQLGVPSEVVFAQRSAFTIVDADGENLVLFAHAGFMPVVTDYIALAPPEGISVSICGTSFAPFEPTEQTAAGMLVIPLGSSETARQALDVITGAITCADFAAMEDEVTISDLLPPLSSGTAPTGLVIRSPSDTYEAMVEEVMVARAETSAVTGGYAIQLRFGPGLANWFAIETSEHLGEPIELLVCGEVLTAPIVQEAITGGEIQVTGNFTKPEAEELVGYIQGARPCAG